ncbi:MAG: pentapeptide repeat-containing protein [Deltaproteobacteria bacterium]|nr:pentapeptide repeat-containing protein [Deltaproteobacteria bacterium]
MPRFEPGVRIAEAKIVALICVGGGMEAYKGVRRDGAVVTVHVLEDPRDDESFVAAAERLLGHEPIEGMAPVVAVDARQGACSTDVAAAGSLLDVPEMGWKEAQKLQLIRRICSTVVKMHAAGIVHGCLRPETVLLDPRNKPAVINARAIDIGNLSRGGPVAAQEHRAHAAPEQRLGRDADERSDVYSVGRLLHFLLTGTAPNEKDEQCPSLDSLKAHPPGIVQVIQMCTMMDADKRYQSAADLFDDLKGLVLGRATGLKGSHGQAVAQTSTPPVRATSLRPKPSSAADRVTKAAEERAARRARVTGKRKQKGGVLRWTRNKALSFGAVGAGVLAIAIAGSFATQSSQGLWTLIALLSAVPLSFVVPPVKNRDALTRFGAFATFIVAVVMVNPTALVLGTDAGGQVGGGSADARQQAFRMQLEDGQKTFLRANLDDTELSGLDLSNAVLDSASLKNAKCRGTNFENASLTNAEMGGADVAGANLSGIFANQVKGWSEVKCDESTLMPTQWSCDKGRPLLTPTKPLPGTKGKEPAKGDAP